MFLECRFDSKQNILNIYSRRSHQRVSAYSTAPHNVY